MRYLRFYSKKEKIVILILCVVIFGLILLREAVIIEKQKDSIEALNYAKEKNLKYSEAFADFTAKLKDEKKDRRKTFYQKKEVIIKPVYFDPNKIDSLELIKTGLPLYIVSNILAYRRKGGIFKTKDKFASVYGMKDEYFQELKDYITIDSVFISDVLNSRKKRKEDFKDTTIRQNLYTEKFNKVVRLEINTIDSLTLMKIPGVGSVGARAIINYRDKLGGYYSVCQVKELTFIADSTLINIEKYLYADTTLIQKIKINSASIPLLKRHPYINFYQAKCISDFRKRKYIDSIHELRFSEEFTNVDFKRISHYIDLSKP